ncbi:hypothetical protein CBL_04400 [Carabus blaptoides fortunei]
MSPSTKYHVYRLHGDVSDCMVSVRMTLAVSYTSVLVCQRAHKGRASRSRPVFNFCRRQDAAHAHTPLVATPPLLDCERIVFGVILGISRYGYIDRLPVALLVRRCPVHSASLSLVAARGGTTGGESSWPPHANPVVEH